MFYRRLHNLLCPNENNEEPQQDVSLLFFVIRDGTVEINPRNTMGQVFSQNVEKIYGNFLLHAYKRIENLGCVIKNLLGKRLFKQRKCSRVLTVSYHDIDTDANLFSLHELTRNCSFVPGQHSARQTRAWLRTRWPPQWTWRALGHHERC